MANHSGFHREPRCGSFPHRSRFAWRISSGRRSRDQGTRGTRRNAAVHKQGLSRDIAARLRSQKYHRAVEIVRLPGALDWNPVADVLDPLLVFIEGLVLFGRKPAGRQAIDRYSIPAPIVCEAHGQLADAAAACAVGTQSSVTRDTGDRANVDDAAEPAPDHAGGHCLRYEEASTKICFENQIPVLPGDLESRFAYIATRIVDEDIDVIEVGLGARRHLLDAT